MRGTLVYLLRSITHSNSYGLILVMHYTPHVD